MFTKEQKNFLNVMLPFECVKNGVNKNFSSLVQTSFEKDFENLSKDEINAIYMFVESFFEIPNLFEQNEFFVLKLIDIKRKILNVCDEIEFSILMKEYYKK